MEFLFLHKVKLPESSLSWILTKISQRKEQRGLGGERGSSGRSGAELGLSNPFPRRLVSRTASYYGDAAVASYLAPEMSSGSTPAAWLC